MTDSILNSVKKVLGLEASYDAFDPDVIMHINTAFATLDQLGVGTVDGFFVEDSTQTWNQILDGDPRLNSVKTYVYLRVRLLFDPPTSSFLLNAMQDQIREMEWRINAYREGESWTDPVTA